MQNHVIPLDKLDQHIWGSGLSMTELGHRAHVDYFRRKLAALSQEYKGIQNYIPAPVGLNLQSYSHLTSVEIARQMRICIAEVEGLTKWQDY